MMRWHVRIQIAFAALLPVASTLAADAQQVSVREGTGRRSAEIIGEVTSRPHAVRAGTQPLVLPRDSTISTSLLVIGRPTYLASRVQGDVVVVGSDLFLRPGVDVTGRAIAIGGTVALTTLGRVAGGVESIRDETYAAVSDGERLLLVFRDLRVGESTPMFQLGGLQGFLPPAYDRVHGLSLPVGGLVTLGERRIELEPTLTYRSRLGVVDPSVTVRVQTDRPTYVEGWAGIGSQSSERWPSNSSERWIRSDLVNSATSFFGGSDARNYHRIRGAEGRLFFTMEHPGRVLHPFVGARYNRVSSITAAGNVYSVIGRKSLEKMARPNPLVEQGNIGSALLGAELDDTTGAVTTRLRVEGERSFTSPQGTANFTQGTIDGRVGFRTFLTQSLHVHLHAVATQGDSVPRARYAYLGGSGTLPLLDMLEQGGTSLLFVESRYLIPVPGIVLPFVGSPLITLKHFLGAAGNGLPSLEQTIGVGVGISVVTLDFYTDAGGNRGSRFGVGISLPAK